MGKIKYPIKLRIEEGSVDLELEKTLLDCGMIKDKTFNLYVTGLPKFLLDINELVKISKIDGRWTYNPIIVAELQMEEMFKQKIKEFGEQNQDKAMTACVVAYLQKYFP